MIAQYIRMGTALGLGIVLGISAVLAFSQSEPVRWRSKPCPQQSFHHASPR